jgi:sensor histidine kinase YesM
VSESIANRYFAGKAVGRRVILPEFKFDIDGGKDIAVEIVGVVGNVCVNSVEDCDAETIYLPEKQNALRARAIAHEAQLTALRGQLNPHFLFNSLNSIQALIAENPTRAQTAVGELASLLRHSLAQGGSALVPLREGIEIVLKYLAIEEMRFEENLIVRVDVDPDSAACLVPRLLLHPLVENAVRYGMQTSSMPLHVGIRASASDGRLCLEVSNSGRWLNEDRESYLREGNGIGLRLVREQLEQCYPDNFRFACVPDDGWVVQRIEITAVGKEQDALSSVAGG